LKAISGDGQSIAQARRRQFDCASVIAISATLMASGAAAAEGTNTSAAPTISEVVVTAQKRSERLQDVPISISVINPAVLADTNAKNLTELSGAVPGVQFNGNGGGGRTYLSMRGTTGSALNTGDEPVAIYLDEVYLARGVTIGAQDLLDIGSIEILRGPQGTLQGRNATAGAILIRTADPTSRPEGYVNLEATSHAEFRGEGAISGPLGGGFEGRLSASAVDARGWGENTFNNTRVGGDKSGQVRAVVTYHGDSPLTARFTADYSSVTNIAALFRNANTNFSPLATGPLVTAPTPSVPLTQAQHDAIYNDNDFASDPNTHTTVDAGGVSSKLTYALSGMDLVSVSGFRRTNVFGETNSSGLSTAPRKGFNNNDDRSDAASEEIRLQSSGERRFSWIAGLYYFYEDQDYADTIYNLKFSTPTSTASRYSGNQKTNSYAAFADGTLKIIDNLQLIGGVRYSNDEKHLVGGIAVTNFGTGVITTTPYTPDPSSWHDVTYRVKLVYHPMPNLMLFAGYGTGFRAGGYNDFAVQAPFAPEKNGSFEAGAKGDFFERRLSVSITGYSNDYTGLQLRAGVPSGGAIITNAGSSTIKGFELEFSALPFEHTHLTANTSYTDAVFTSFPKAVDLFNHFVDATGNVLPNAPKWQFFVSGEQDFPLANGMTLTAEVNYRWRDTIQFYFTNQDALPLRDGPGGTLNGRLSLRNANWTGSAFVDNITNARIVTTDVITFSYPEVGLNEPRVFGVSVERRF
jgi:iron complex outermembrane recepter protein